MSCIIFKSLYQSYLVCRRGKRKAFNTQRYEMQLLDNQHNTAVALHRRDYQPKLSLCFVATKPKARQIHAADFSDRVVHHWLVPKLEVLYEPLFIHCVYSNRQGKGTHKAVARLQYFMQSQRGKKNYFLQLDIANFLIPRLKPHTTVLSHYKSHCEWFRQRFSRGQSDSAARVNVGCFSTANAQGAFRVFFRSGCYR